MSRAGNETSSPPDGDVESYRELKAYLDCRSRKVDPPGPLVDAWDRFYRFYTPRIRAFLTRSGLQEADREDCLQDVWKEVVAHLDHLPYEPRGGGLSTWLMTVARTRVVDSIRRLRHVWVGLEEAKIPVLDRGPDPAAECERRTLQARVRDVLAQLSERVSPLSYRVLYQRGIEGRTSAEVADALRLTPDQVRLHYHRAKRRFRDLFEASEAVDRLEGDGERLEKGGRTGLPCNEIGPRTFSN